MDREISRVIIDDDGQVEFETYVPKSTYLAAEKEIEKLHELNWKLEKVLMEERGYKLDTECNIWWKNDYVVVGGREGWKYKREFPVGEVIG